MAERDCAVVRHFPANTFSSFARSSFLICHTSCVTRCSPAGSFTHSAKNFAGVTCQERPYLSATHPHCTSFPPPAVSFSQSRGRGIDLLLRVAVDHERDGFGEVELPRKLSGFNAVNSWPFISNDTVITWPFFSGMSSPA